MNTTKSRNCVYNCNYHLVWIPKYRKEILTGDVRKFTIKTLKEIAKNKGFEIITMEVCADHIHLFVSFRPALSISKVIKLFKGISARKIAKKFPNIKPKGDSWWCPSYYVGTAGNVSSENIKDYIEYAQDITARG